MWGLLLWKCMKGRTVRKKLHRQKVTGDPAEGISYLWGPWKGFWDSVWGGDIFGEWGLTWGETALSNSQGLPFILLFGSVCVFSVCRELGYLTAISCGEEPSLYFKFPTWHSSAIMLIESSHLTDRAPITPGTTTRNGYPWSLLRVFCERVNNIKYSRAAQETT